jgi:hypothetical protein
MIKENISRGVNAAGAYEQCSSLNNHPSTENSIEKKLQE